MPYKSVDPSPIGKAPFPDGVAAAFSPNGRVVALPYAICIAPNYGAGKGRMTIISFFISYFAARAGKRERAVRPPSSYYITMQNYCIEECDSTTTTTVTRLRLYHERACIPANEWVKYDKNSGDLTGDEIDGWVHQVSSICLAG